MRRRVHGDPGTASVRYRKAAPALMQEAPGEALAVAPGASSPPPPEPGSHPLGGHHELLPVATAWLRQQGPGRVLAEVGLEHGQQRVDLLSLSHEALHGLELKSERDTLKRLPAQVRAYSAALDFCTLAVAEHHLAEAQALVPEWCGLLVAVRRQRLHLLPVREPAPNPAPNSVACARLLWRDEVLTELRRAGVTGPIRGPGEYLRHRLAALVPADELRAQVRAVLCARQDWITARKY